MSTVGAVDHTVQLTHEWLKDLRQIGEFDSDEQAWSALRAVSQAVRDRLTVDEASHLAAQLPCLIRGVYFEGWSPSNVPVKARSRDQFLGLVNEKMSGGTSIAPQHAAEAVFRLLNDRITPGEVDDVRHMLPLEVQELWSVSKS
ncbi:MAG: DUF2267 domain-containing protein [Planctomycetota bacterium]